MVVVFHPSSGGVQSTSVIIGWVVMFKQNKEGKKPLVLCRIWYQWKCGCYKVLPNQLFRPIKLTLTFHPLSKSHLFSILIHLYDKWLKRKIPDFFRSYSVGLKTSTSGARQVWSKFNRAMLSWYLLELELEMCMCTEAQVSNSAVQTSVTCSIVCLISFIDIFRNELLILK